MRSFVVPLTALALTLTLVSPTIAEAQRRRARRTPPAPAQTEASEGETEPLLDEEARALFVAGRAAFDAGRYESALDYFSRAYALSGRPGLLFNIGSASERLRHDAQALHAYQAYLEAFPDAPNREYAESRIAFLSEQVRLASVREEARAALDPGGSRAAPQQPGAARGRVSAAPEAALTLGPADADETDRPPQGGDVTREWWFWTLIGVAVVGAGAGITAGVLASEGTASGAPVQGDFGPGGVIVALESF